MNEWSIDRDNLALFVHATRTTKLNLDMRQAAESAGVSASLFARVEARQTISVANFLALCVWIGANPFWFLVDPRTGKRLVEPPAAPAHAEAA